MRLMRGGGECVGECGEVLYHDDEDYMEAHKRRGQVAAGYALAVLGS